MFRTGLAALLVALFATLYVLPAVAASPPATPAGAALGVDPDAKALAGKATRVLTVGADVFIGDKVVTDAAGLVQIRFSDKTELVVGPNSSLVLEDYLLRNDGSAGRLAIDALAGTFRFVTGGAAKDRYAITTPTASIGVRGTAFDFTVEGLKTTVLVFHGAVLLCTLDNKCVTVDDTCELGEADSTQSLVLGKTDDVRSAGRDALRTLFPYADNQADLLTAFKLEQARRCLNRPAPTPPGLDNDTAVGGGQPNDQKPRQR